MSPFQRPDAAIFAATDRLVLLAWNWLSIPHRILIRVCALGMVVGMWTDSLPLGWRLFLVGTSLPIYALSEWFERQTGARILNERRLHSRLSTAAIIWRWVLLATWLPDVLTLRGALCAGVLAGYLFLSNTLTPTEPPKRPNFKLALPVLNPVRAS